MADKIYKIAILGIGGRGGDTYGNLLMGAKDRFEIVSLCDLKADRLARFGEKYGVDKSMLFTDEKEFFKEKRADILIIATLDNDHVRHATKAFEVGYDILLEKPITEHKEECEQILAAQKKYGRKALVCHVLRYAPAYLKLSELLNKGEIGKLVSISAIERLGYWHQAHSYVRGNWRTRKEAAPMILAKCCHDLDLLQYYAKSKCRSVSSMGDLYFFKEENAPAGSTARCVDCPHVDSCPYSAKVVYITNWENCGKPADVWPYNIIAQAPLTKEKLETAIEKGPYGRCAFRCDNDVVDHQIVMMQFENGVTAELTMTPFTRIGGRRYHFFGTYGDILFDETENTIKVSKYSRLEESYVISTRELVENGYGHGGGDQGLIDTLYDMLEGKAESSTSLDASVESHLMGIAAEESRLMGGALVEVHK